MTLIEKKNVVKTKVNIQMCVETWEAGPAVGVPVMHTST